MSKQVHTAKFEVTFLDDGSAIVTILQDPNLGVQALDEDMMEEWMYNMHDEVQSQLQDIARAHVAS